ncbi:MAG: DNA/RNA nuclease SfsA [Candidatus Tectomicrobia bacterium]|uniref:Sugar fermentation stimulation protein homolog n=1 Tax=Tectimicrobiota bacterium TaxID=2528274 RepID=A0A932GRM5_UNCTE|nr:DNA/RNA nuclease SfsA [Candidatus Tectomicrobia bacterium]
MRFPRPLVPGILIRRYKRFLADVRLADGAEVTAHCPNSGSMRSCNEPGRPVLLSRSSNENRKLAYTWEMIRMGRVWVGINTSLPNRIVRQAIEEGRISELGEYPEIRSEVPFGKASRVDLLLQGPGAPCYVEVKNVSLVEKEIAYFPDSVTARGTKHLRELAARVRQGDRAVMFYLVQRSDGRVFRPADHIDPIYGKALRRALRAGVEILVYRARVSPRGVVIDGKIPYEIPVLSP